MRRTSGCTMIGSAGFSGALGPVRERIAKRSLAYANAPWKDASADATPCSAVPIRAVFIKVNMQFRPLFSGPINQPLAPSKFITQVELPWIPILCSIRSEEHTSELQSRPHLVCRLLLEK